MARKAQNKPPYTRKKLFRYRTAQRQAIALERKEQDQLMRTIERTGRKTQSALEGCKDA